MYTYYFQAVSTLAGQRFVMTAAKSHASGAQPSEDGSIHRELYQEENLQNLVSNGYRVVIDPWPPAQERLQKTFSQDEAREPARLKLAHGYRAVYPPTMFAIPRTQQIFEYQIGPSDGMDSNAANGAVDGFKADQQDAAWDTQVNRLDSTAGREHYFSRARCGEDIPPDDGIEIYRQDEPGGEFKQTIKKVGAPSAGPLPPQAPLAPTEKVDEYGVPEIGSRSDFFKIDGTPKNDLREAEYVVRKEYLTAEEILDIYGIVVVSQPGIRGWTIEDGFNSSNPPPIPPEGSMLLPSTFEGKPVLQGPVSPLGPQDASGRTLPYEGELPANAKLAAAIYGAIHDDRGKDVSPEKSKGFWQRIKDFFNGEPSNPLIS